MADPLVITLYTRPGCDLCDDVAEQLEALRQEVPFTLDLIDITTDIALHTQWWSAIPVVAVGDTILRAPIQPLRLETTVRRAVRGHLLRTMQPLADIDQARTV